MQNEQEKIITLSNLERYTDDLHSKYLDSILSYSDTMSILESIIMPDGANVISNSLHLPEGCAVIDNSIIL